MENGSKGNVIERSWYGDRMGKPNNLTREEYGLDMARIREWGEQVNVWDGKDRAGNPLKVVWVSKPRFGSATLYAYEIGEDKTAAEPVKDEPAPIIHEVGWKLRRKITEEALRRDMAYAEEMRFSVHEWHGEDRQGKDMVVVWVECGEHRIGHLVAVYEIQGRV
ncbi:hypothetical protein [Streptomyces achromogenes]|uniref:hypothetical protein n=1 Tax=Streptomyces achromogenes TaxID=67255 RepID=UPI0036AD1FEC